MFGDRLMWMDHSIALNLTCRLETLKLRVSDTYTWKSHHATDER